MSKGDAMRNTEPAVDGTALDICFLLCLVAVGKWGTKTNRADTSGEERSQNCDVIGSKSEPLLSAFEGLCPRDNGSPAQPLSFIRVERPLAGPC